MIKTLLLDLDGTLSTMDTKHFTKSYLTALAQKMAPLIDVNSFFPKIMASTEVMIKNTDPFKTNLEVFIDNFSQAVSVKEDILWPLFLDFYAYDFPNYGHLVTPNPLSPRLVEEATKRGMTIGIACNPLMPKVAILERIKWAGIKAKDLSFIPSIEEMHFCKPNPDFFKEIINILGEKPEDCLMVGNDIKEDMVASKIGIKTYLVTENYKEKVKCNYQGDLGKLLELIKTDSL